MKKTTYILIGAVAFIWLACFILPPMAMKRILSPSTTVNIASLTEDLKGDETTVRDTLPAFSAFEIESECCPLYYKDEKGDLQRTIVKILIEEDASLTAPIAEGAAFWMKNVRFEADDDGGMNAVVDFSNYKGNDTDDGVMRLQLMTETPFVYAATIRVPAGMLTRVSNDGDSLLGITLRGLHGDSMTCEGYPSGFQLEDCSFKSLNWE